MRRLLMVMAAACAMSGAASMGASAAPTLGGGGLAGQIESEPLIQQARLYCYNRYTGAFLYWGRCRSARPAYYRRTPGRTYCYNKYTGRFLYWGACRR